MTQIPTERNVAKVNPGPNVYTVLLIIAILGLWVGIGFAANRLMSDPPTGYGLSVGDLFSPADEPRIDKLRTSNRRGRSSR